MSGRHRAKAGLLVILGLAGYASAQRDPPTQPLPFSHKKHLALGLQCQLCHSNPDPGDRMTLPAAARCMTCHLLVAKDKPAIRSLAAYAQSKEPIPWKRVYAVAAGVYWNHRSHVAAGLACDDCHGRVSELEVMARVKDVTSMGGCMDCHRDRKAGLGCDLCHEGK